MTIIKNFAQEITQLHGKIKRCRNCYMYTTKGRRLIDMYQEGGRAILGWSFGKAKLTFKNLLDRSLTGSFESAYTCGLAKAVLSLVPHFSSVCVCSKNSLPKDLPLWRPWQESFVSTDIAEVLIPFPWAGDYALVVYTENYKGIIPESLVIPPVLSCAIARSFYDLAQELKNRSEEDFSLYDDILSLYFRREGPYLYPLVSSDNYKDFFKHCLQQGLLISPDYAIPSVVPFGADKGVFSQLKRNPYDR